MQTSEQQQAKLELLTGESRFVPYCVLHTWAKAGARDFALHRTILKTLRQTPPLEQHVSGLLTPALIVGGELDRIVPPASVKTLTKVFTHAQTIVAQDMGHVLQIEAPAQPAQDYLAFRAKLAAGAQRT